MEKTGETVEIKRIGWCDVYKGILIALVVIGHATGRFNPYIYQFHMAGFFFVSGYTCNTDRQDLFGELIKLTYRLIVPYVVLSLSGLWIFWIFDKVHILDMISTTQYPDRFQDAVTAFFVHGTVYLTGLAQCGFYRCCQERVSCFAYWSDCRKTVLLC